MSTLIRRFFLCAIGLIACLAAWPVVEITLLYQSQFPSYLVFNIFIGAVCGLIIGGFFGTTEGIISSVKVKIIKGMVTGFFIGIFGGAIGFLIGQASLFIIGEFFLHSSYKLQSFGLPLSRAIGWAFLGIFIGMVEGVRALSMKKIKIGILGGLIGGFIGGLILEHMSSVVPSMMLARLIGLLVFGFFLGLFYGFIEGRLSYGALRLLNGQFKGKEFLINQRRMRIGQSNKNDIKMDPDYYSVADAHAEMKIKKGEVIIHGLNPANPVYVNDDKIQEHQLKLNDVIKIGSAKFLFKF